MLALARDFHGALERFLDASRTAVAVAFDTEFSMQNFKLANPFASQEEVFAEIKPLANRGQLLQIGLAAVQSDNTVEKLTLYVRDNDNPLDMSTLRFLLGAGFDIYKYFRQYFRLDVDYYTEIASWNALFCNYEEKDCKDAQMGKDAQAIVEKAQEMIAAKLPVDFEVHVSREWYFKSLGLLQSYFQEKLARKLLVAPVLFTAKAEEKLYCRVTDTQQDVKPQLLEALRFVEFDIKNIALVFEQLYKSKTLLVGFSLCSDLALLHNALLRTKLTDLATFQANVRRLFPNFLDLQVALQHPVASKFIENLCKQKKTPLRSRSLTGYYGQLVSSQEQVRAHDAGSDALMTLRVFYEVNAIYALQPLQCCNLHTLRNQISIYGCFTTLGQQQANLHPVYPLYLSEKVKVPESAIKKAIDAVDGVSANLVHGTRVGQVFVGRDSHVKPIRLSSIFNNQGKPRCFFKWLANDGLLHNEFGRVMTPSAARKLFEILEQKK